MHLVLHHLAYSSWFLEELFLIDYCDYCVIIVTCKENRTDAQTITITITLNSHGALRRLPIEISKQGI